MRPDDEATGANAEARHRAMFEQLRVMLATDGIDVIHDDFRYEAFGFWNLTIARAGRRFAVSWDALESTLECTTLVQAPPLHSLRSFAHQKLKDGLPPATLPVVRSFIVDQTGRVLRGEVPLPRPFMVSRSTSGLGIIGSALIILGLALAAGRFGLRAFFATLITHPNLESLGVAQTIVAGVLLVAVALSRTFATAK